jgi:NAD(P)-dependent dehydrogenase (short-subunit alcohol dehydrogenase family)
MKLTGYHVAITGGSGGIGSALATGLLEDGATVYNLDFVKPADESSQFIQVDLSDENSVQEAFKKIEKLDAIIVAAGVQLVGSDSKIGDVTLDTWQRTIDINLTGAFLSVKHAMPFLVKSGRGSVVLIGSPTAISMEGAGYSAYGASKAGMMGLSRIIAADYKEDGVRSNVVVPGSMITPLIAKILEDPAKGAGLVARTPLGRLGEPRELVGIVNWLVSTDSSFATGASYAVDGGMTAR